MLEHIPMFGALTADELDTLLHTVVTRKYPRNTVVISEGDNTSALYLIKSGTVRVTKTHDDGKEVTIALLGEGEYFGEMALIDEQPRSATIVTKTECEFWLVRKPDFQKALKENPDLAFHIMQGLCAKLRAANNNIESLALMDVYGRLARILIDMAEPDGQGRRRVRQPLTHRELANMVGSSREMVSRIMKDLVTGGYIQVHKQRITILQKLPSAY